MTEYDPLELELAALRPREPSAELKGQIARRLDATALSRTEERQSLWRASAFVGGLLAASLAAIVAWQGGNQRRAPEPAALDVNISAAFDESLPSVWTYRRALSKSPYALDVLLDKHSAQTRDGKSVDAPVFALVRLNSETDSLLGEL